MADNAELLIDVGSTRCRAVAVDSRGRALGRASRALAVRQEDDGIEYDAETLIAAVESVVDEASEGRRIEHVALAVQRGSVVCWDRHTRKALSPVISWRDRRTAGGPSPSMAAREIKQRTGLRFSPYAGAPKLAWCRSNLPSVQRAERNGRLAAGPLGSFIAARLAESERPVVDDTLAQRTLLWSHASGRWDRDLLKAFDIPESILPALAVDQTDFPRVQRLSGQPILATLIGDQNALPFIDGMPRIDTLYINLGTGAFLLRPVTGLLDCQSFQLSTLGRDRGWALEGSVHGAASALEWFGRREGRVLEPALLQSIERIEHPPLFVNAIDGLGSPWWESGPEPAFVAEDGRNENGFQGRLLAVVESIAFLVRANFDAMNRLIGPPRRVILAGGLSRIEVLDQRIAALLKADVQRLSAAEGTATGLWCRLCGEALASDAFERVITVESSAIESRYRRWLAGMPAILAESG